MSSFKEVVERINQAVIDNDSTLKNLQRIRADHYGMKVSNYSFLNYYRDFVTDDNYTFHYGGGNEFQFNISEEPLHNGKKVFRYGLAFSLNKTRETQPEDLFPLIDRFNDLRKIFPEYLKNESLWIWDAHDRTDAEPVRKIKKREKVEGNFIFIGKALEKTSDEITDDDVELIIDELEYLLPVYQYVQLGMENTISNKKIARICFNDLNWTKPSGRYGKSTNPSFEKKYGYGHEEWLLDFSMIGKDGYKYGMLEPIRKHRDTYEGQFFDIALYAINGITKERLWIGEIKNCEVIDVDTSLKAIKEYRKEGWLDDMIQDVENFNFEEYHELPEWADNGKLFNVRFKPEDYHPFDEHIVVAPNDKAISINRYKLLNFTKEPDGISENKDFELRHGAKKPKLRKGATRRSTEKEIEIPYIHDEISLGLENELVKQYGKGNVFRENPIESSRARIDMTARNKEEVYFYEIKTYHSLRVCIRKAIGQLMEYCYYPGKTRADRLYIVSYHKAGKDDREYMKHLRKETQLPIYYMQYDRETKKLATSI